MDNNKSGLTDNVAGLLAYFFVPAIVFLALDPYRTKPFVRFHCFQSLFLTGAWMVFAWGLKFLFVSMMFMPMMFVVAGPIVSLVSLAFFVAFVFAAVKAFNNEQYKLPVIGDLAQKQV